MTECRRERKYVRSDSHKTNPLLLLSHPPMPQPTTQRDRQNWEGNSNFGKVPPNQPAYTRNNRTLRLMALLLSSLLLTHMNERLKRKLNCSFFMSRKRKVRRKHWSIDRPRSCNNDLGARRCQSEGTWYVWRTAAAFASFANLNSW